MLNRIKQYRLAAGLTPADISSMFKIPYRTVQKWEKGELTPPAWAEQQIITRLQAARRQEPARHALPEQAPKKHLPPGMEPSGNFSKSKKIRGADPLY